MANALEIRLVWNPIAWFQSPFHALTKEYKPPYPGSLSTFIEKPRGSSIGLATFSIALRNRAFAIPDRKTPV
jgi:hypothetical protein